MSSIFANIKNYEHAYEIIGITDDEVIVQAVEQHICPECGHVEYLRGPVRHFPREKYNSFAERLSKVFDELIK